MRFGIRAVCGIGSPSGCLKSAVTANQSAIAPTIDASAPAFTNPRNPSRSRVTTYTTAANSRSPTATVRILRRPGAAERVGSGISCDEGCGDGHGRSLPPILADGVTLRESRPCLAPS